MLKNSSQKSMPCAQICVRLTNSKGLHARAAGKLAKVARQFEAEVRIKTLQGESSGRSMLDLMMLGARLGESLEIKTTGNQAKEALQALVELVENRFGEEE